MAIHSVHFCYHSLTACDSLLVELRNALSQVHSCRFMPEDREDETYPPYLTIGKKDLKITERQEKHQREKPPFQYNNHCSNVHTITGVTFNLLIFPEQYRPCAKDNIFWLTCS